MLSNFRVVVIGTVLVAAGQAMAVDVCGNGGFEDEGFDGPNSAFYWHSFASGGPGSVSERSTLSPLTGTYAQHLVANGADAMGGTAVVTQNTVDATGGVSLEPGTPVVLSFDARGAAGPGGVGFYALRILNSAGAIVSDTGLQVYFPNNNWAHFTTRPLTVPAFGAAPNDAYFAYVEIVVAAGAFAASTIEAHIDSVAIDATLVAGGPPCPADYNGDGGVDGTDVEVFFTDWGNGDPRADVNADGGVDGTDVEVFFRAWENGGC